MDPEVERLKQLTKDAKKALSGLVFFWTIAHEPYRIPQKKLSQALTDASAKLKWAINLLPNLAKMCLP